MILNLIKSAKELFFDNSTSALKSNNVQDAIDEMISSNNTATITGGSELLPQTKYSLSGRVVQLQANGYCGGDTLANSTSSLCVGIYGNVDEYGISDGTECLPPEYRPEKTIVQYVNIGKDLTGRLEISNKGVVRLTNYQDLTSATALNWNFTYLAAL